MRLALLMILILFCLAARDPFEPVYVAPQKEPAVPTDYSLNQLRLKAVIWGTGKNVALFQADDGKTFLVKMGEQIGKRGGKITKINDRMVIVQGPFGKKIFKIQGSL